MLLSAPEFDEEEADKVDEPKLRDTHFGADDVHRFVKKHTQIAKTIS